MRHVADPNANSKLHNHNRLLVIFLSYICASVLDEMSILNELRP